MSAKSGLSWLSVFPKGQAWPPDFFWWSGIALTLFLSVLELAFEGFVAF